MTESSRQGRERSRDRGEQRRSRSRSQSPKHGPSGSTRHRSSRSRSPVSRHRHRSHSRDGRTKRSRSRSVSSEDSDRKRHKHKHRDRDRDSKKDRHGDKKKHSKRRSSRSQERHDRKKSKKAQKKAAAETSKWGKYGIISELDIYTKASEFHAWLVEERKINPETISKEQSKREFAKFTEDFNTATLPSEKFYNMTAYETRMAALRAGEYIPPPQDNYDANADLLAIQGAHKKKVVEHESYLSREQLMDLRRVGLERVEASKMKLLGMDVKQTMGVRMDGSMFDG